MFSVGSLELTVYFITAKSDVILWHLLDAQSDFILKLQKRHKWSIINQLTHVLRTKLRNLKAQKLKL